MNRPLTALAALVALTACNNTLSPASLSEPDIMRSVEQAPPGAEPGSCWGKDVTPAIIETVTEQIMLQPAEVHSDGSIKQPALYKSETRQMIVRERKEIWFETPCDAELTPEFIASVQRALAARGLYRGAINGEMDARTRRAVRAFQAPQGLDSGILSLAAARKLGLVAIKRPATE